MKTTRNTQHATRNTQHATRNTQHSTRNLKLIPLLFLVLLFINSCQKQDDNEIKQTSERRYHLTRVSPKDFEANSILNNKIADISKSINMKKNNTYARYENIEFYLNLNEATYIESLDGSYHSYTFAIYNENYSFDINNIVLSLNSDGTYEADLVTYSLTEDERYLIDSGIEIELIDKMSIEPFDIEQINTFGRGDVGSTCNELVYIGQEDCSCHDIHGANGCTHPNDIFEWQEVDCVGGGNGTSGNTGNPSGNPSGGNPGSTGGNSTPNPKATSLTNPDGSTSSAQNVIDALNLLLGEGDSFEFDGSLTSSETLNFDNVAEFEEFLNSVPDYYSPSHSSTLESNGTVQRDNINFDFNVPLFSYGVEMVVEKEVPELNTCDCIEIIDVSTNLYGNTTFISYEESGDYWTEISTAANTIKVSIKGILTTKVTIAGFPFKISRIYTFYVLYNYSTGNIIDYGFTTF